MKIIGVGEIRKTKSKNELPSPREIGNVLAGQFVSFNGPGSEYTNNLMGLMFGQLLTHDTSNNKQYSIEGFVLRSY